VSYLHRNLGASDHGEHLMTFNRIQLQPGMPLSDFLRCFGTEAVRQHAEAVFNKRL
jgi:hypothetical protein